MYKSVILGSSQTLCPLCSCDLQKVGRLQVEARSSPAFPLAGFSAFEDVAGLCGVDAQRRAEMGVLQP